MTKSKCDMSVMIMIREMSISERNLMIQLHKIAYKYTIMIMMMINNQPIGNKPHINHVQQSV